MRHSAFVTIAFALFVACTCLTAATDLDDPAEPWRTAQAGVTTEVPAPFEPLRLENETVRLCLAVR